MPAEKNSWVLNDELELDALFDEPSATIASEAEPKAEPTDDSTAIARLRAELNRCAEGFWRRYKNRLGSQLYDRTSKKKPKVGDYFVLTTSLPADKAEWTIDLPKGPLVVRRDSSLLGMLKHVEGIKTSWGFGDSEQVEVAVVVQDKKKPVLHLRAVRVPGQFVVFHLPPSTSYAPGLDAAETRLAAFREGEVVVAVPNPEDLLPLLLAAIGSNDTEAFGRLWVPGEHHAVQRRRFNQFAKVYEACAGNFKFDAFDGRCNPDNYPDCGNVRMYVKRQYTDGKEGRSPLVLIQHEGNWRISRGII